jgi:hypothetical protein
LHGVDATILISTEPDQDTDVNAILREQQDIIVNHMIHIQNGCKTIIQGFESKNAIL